ncbi:MAG: hypothetical protein FK731_14745 [Asgard group archaeon]|nr:hypothetical protein [Asgard group archaeon]
MSESKYLFERAKKAATKAIQAERNGNLEIAFDEFLRAADILNQLIKVERSQKVRDSYYVKAKEYINRAKEIKILITSSKESDLSEVSDDTFPSPPKPEKKTPPPPPPPSEDKYESPKPKDTQQPPMPPPPKDMITKMMRGEDDESDKSLSQPKDTTKPEVKPTTPPSDNVKKEPKKEIQLPTKTTFEILYDEGKYRDCVLECAKSVEAELRVRMGLFDEQLTLGMLIDRGMKKGLDILNEFKYVNILINRIEHEHYRPKPIEAQKAVDITNKILMS